MAALPAASAPARTTLGTILEFVKIEHSLFALPFVLAGMVVGLVAVGRPLEASADNARLLALVLAAAVSARTLAMTLNRIVDRDVDAANPRTASRALAAGSMSLSTAWALAAGSLSVLVVSAALLNPLCLALAPLLVALFFVYPYAKRHTWGCHFVLGLAFFCAPGGGFLAVTGSFDATWLGLFFGFAALFWVAGFDVIYALLDVAHDRAHGIRSIPARFGVAGARLWARALHVLTVLALAAGGWVLGLAWPYWISVAAVGALLVAEHALVDPEDPVALNRAFFNVNAGIGWIVLAGLVLGL